ncbi:MliC family protein [Kingella negevensis]|uniref:MliC family protein n=1 Tax=Kingella negevensis TaxID=1522312 RepID=UPI00050A0D0E|nr:MliC family protein [Kingella negevensis]MDK4689597.1 MliC family protein [Kingella negevensis]WII90397.1 MliC family protein [Kingella negevensis]
MSIKRLSLAAVLLASLAACSSNNATQPTTPAAPAEQPAQTAVLTGNVTKFACENGQTVTLKQNGSESVTLAVDTIGSSVELTRAVSGSGVRYASNKGFYNKPTEFHFKGAEGYLEFTDPYGNKVKTNCNETK